MSSVVDIERRDDGVAVLRLDNPKVNALSTEVLSQLEAAARLLTADPPGAVVVTGGDKVFAAGADISEFGGPAEAERIGGMFLRSLSAVASIPRATIAAVSGYALGGGCGDREVVAGGDGDAGWEADRRADAVHFAYR